MSYITVYKILKSTLHFELEGSLFSTSMGAHVSRTDFEWTEEEIPHSARRMEILRKQSFVLKASNLADGKSHFFVH